MLPRPWYEPNVGSPLGGGDGSGAPARHFGMVVYPYGLPARPEHAELCSRFIVEAGADLGRVIDGPFPSLERFIEYAKRLPALRQAAVARQRPIVVLTRTSPVAITIVSARRKVESAVAGLSGAVWAIFVDPVQDPFFFETVQSLGRLEGATEDMPIWYDDDGRPYVVVSSDASRAGRVRTAVRVLLDSD